MTLMSINHGTDSGINMWTGWKNEVGIHVLHCCQILLKPHPKAMSVHNIYFHKINYLCTFLHVVSCRRQMSAVTEIIYNCSCVSSYMRSLKHWQSMYSWIPAALRRSFCTTQELPVRQEGSGPGQAEDIYILLDSDCFLKLNFQAHCPCLPPASCLCSTQLLSRCPLPSLLFPAKCIQIDFKSTLYSCHNTYIRKIQEMLPALP